MAILQMRNRNELIRAMRADGKTYKEIAEHFGSSKQYIYQLMHRAGYTRRYQRDIDKIRYQGVYELFQNDPRMSFSKFQKLFSNGNNNEKLYQCLRNYVTGKCDSCTVTINNIKNVTEATGMTFEYLFKEREI